MTQQLTNTITPPINKPDITELNAGVTSMSDFTMGNKPLDPSLLPSDYVSSIQLAPPLIQDRIIEFLTVGGPVVWILLMMSLVAVSIMIIKVWQFSRLKPERRTSIDKSISLWHKGDKTAAKLMLNAKYSVEKVTLVAMKGLTDNTVDNGLLKEDLRPLEVIATLSPLLGLLGTVIGMIMAF